MADETVPSPTRIYFDGGCDLATGAMELRVEGPRWHRHEAGLTGVVQGIGVAVPPGGRPDGTGNRAEWLAAVLAVEEALARGLRDIEIVGDSQLVVEQADGPPWKCKEAVLIDIRRRYVALRPQFRRIVWTGVGKQANLARRARLGI